jgi:putative transcriptional regulator
MNRLLLLENVRETLLKSGFAISDEIIDRTICFDIIARRNEILLIIKVLVNIDSFNKSSAMELKVISNFFPGSPMVIGNHSGAGLIEDGAIYLRYGIPIISPHTIYEHFIDDIPPLVFAAPGGFFVRIDGELMRKIRQKRGISLGTLADAVGVSRRAVQMYEKGMNAMVDVAIKIQNYLNESIILPSNPLDVKYNTGEVESYKSNLESAYRRDLDVIKHLSVLGYDVIPTKHSPFDAITAKQKILILTGIESNTKYLERKAKTIHNISQLAEKHSVFFVQKHVRDKNIEGTPIIALEELMTIEDSKEIMELINERAQ